MGMCCGPHSRLRRTVIRGSTEPRCVIKMPWRLGPPMGWPSTSTSPASSGSKPARRLKKVDLPHPEGPTTAMNSRAATVRSMPSSTETVPSLVRYAFHTSRTRSLVVICIPPAHLVEGLKPTHSEIEEIADHADDHHPSYDQVVAGASVTGVNDEIPQPRIDRHHLGGHHDQPGHAEPNPHASDNLRQCGREDHLPEEAESAHLEVARRTNILTLHKMDTGGCRDDNRKERG